MKSILFSIPFSLLSCETTPKAEPTNTPTSVNTIQTIDPSPWLPDSFSPPDFMTDALRQALTDKDWPLALSIIPRTSPEGKILATWVAIQQNDVSSVTDYIETISTFDGLPADYQNFMLGTLYLELDNNTKAARYFALISANSPLRIQSQWMQAQADISSLKQNTDSKIDTTALNQRIDSTLQSLSTQEHPFTNGDRVLKALIDRNSDDASNYTYYRELWASYPYSEHTKATRAKLKALESKGNKYKATTADWNKRSTQLMQAWQWKSLIAELKPIISTLQMTDEDACAVRYAYGRSHFKINAVTKATQILPKVGTECQGKNDDVGAKAWYLIGKSYERKKMWGEAAKAFQKIPELYPEHTMADDGYALAGIGYQETGDLSTALSLWEKQVKTFPDGDLVGEGYWRLAWTSFLEGDTSKAIAWAQEAQKVVSASGHPYQYFAFPYWEARWKVYPSNTDHGVQNSDPNLVAEGIDQWKALVEHYPSEFYSLLAAAHLWELKPDWIAKQQWTAPKATEATWTIPEELSQSAILTDTTQLAQLGMFKEAQARFAPIRKESTTNFAMYAHLVGQDNWSMGHDLLHKYIQKNPPHTWTENQSALWLQSHPNQYWDLLSNHATNHPDDYPYDIRIFHALVREESSFNKDIVSWAGAKGLSQLMPATADRVAGWVGLSVNSSTIFDPSTNLRIGSKYLGYLHGYFNGNPFLAVAAYNAGEGNVGKWLKSKGNLPTDMFVESIPFRETRHYVKRVLGTYQTYHLLYDQSNQNMLFTDLHTFNHQAKP